MSNRVVGELKVTDREIEGLAEEAGYSQDNPGEWFGAQARIRKAAEANKLTAQQITSIKVGREMTELLKPEREAHAREREESYRRQMEATDGWGY